MSAVADTVAVECDGRPAGVTDNVEANLVGALLLSPDAWEPVCALVDATDFARRDYQLIFATGRELHEQGCGVDVATVANRMELKCTLADAGGLASIGALARHTHSAANVETYARIVRERARARRAAAIGKELAAGKLDADAAARALEQLRDDGGSVVRYTPGPAGRWLLPAGELLTEPAPPRWQIRDILERGVLADIYGRRESLKSFLALSLALTVSRGGEWFGHAVERAPVAYLAGEGNRGIRRRVKAWASLHGEPGAFVASRCAAALLDPAQFEMAYRELSEFADREGGLGLIVADTLSRFMVPGDENSTRDMGLLIARLDHLRQTFDATVLVAHHTGHGADERARGSSAWPAALDASIRVERPDMNEPAAVAICDKAKDAERFAPFEFRCDVVVLPWTDDRGVPSTSLVVAGIGEAKLVPKGGEAIRAGKNQRLALKVLARMFGEARERLKEQGREPELARVDLRAWREATGLGRGAWRDIPTSLAARGLVRLLAEGFVEMTDEGDVAARA